MASELKREDLVALVDAAVNVLTQQLNELCGDMRKEGGTFDDIATFNINVAAQFASRIVASTAFHAGYTINEMVDEHNKAVKITATTIYETIVESGFKPGEPLAVDLQ